MMYLPRNIKIACNQRGLTHYGGIFYFQEFLRMLQFRRCLGRQMSDFRPHHDYSLSQIILALVYPVILGLDCLESASFLRPDATFQYLTGLPGYPDPQSLRRFLLPKLSDSCRPNVHLRIKEESASALLVECWSERPNCLTRTLFWALNAATRIKNTVLVHTPPVAITDRWVSR
jgi:hypothetical protein